MLQHRFFCHLLNLSHLLGRHRPFASIYNIKVVAVDVEDDPEFHFVARRALRSDDVADAFLDEFLVRVVVGLGDDAFDLRDAEKDVVK